MIKKILILISLLLCFNVSFSEEIQRIFLDQSKSEGIVDLFLFPNMVSNKPVIKKVTFQMFYPDKDGYTKVENNMRIKVKNNINLGTATDLSPIGKIMFQKYNLATGSNSFKFKYLDSGYIRTVQKPEFSTGVPLLANMIYLYQNPNVINLTSASVNVTYNSNNGSGPVSTNINYKLFETSTTNIINDIDTLMIVDRSFQGLNYENTGFYVEKTVTKSDMEKILTNPRVTTLTYDLEAYQKYFDLPNFGYTSISGTNYKRQINLQNMYEDDAFHFSFPIDYSLAKESNEISMLQINAIVDTSEGSFINSFLVIYQGYNPPLLKTYNQTLLIEEDLTRNYNFGINLIATPNNATNTKTVTPFINNSIGTPEFKNMKSIEVGAEVISAIESPTVNNSLAIGELEFDGVLATSNLRLSYADITEWVHNINFDKTKINYIKNSNSCILESISFNDGNVNNIINIAPMTNIQINRRNQDVSKNFSERVFAIFVERRINVNGNDTYTLLNQSYDGKIVPLYVPVIITKTSNRFSAIATKYGSKYLKRKGSDSQDYVGMKTLVSGYTLPQGETTNLFFDQSQGANGLFSLNLASDILMIDKSLIDPVLLQDVYNTELDKNQEKNSVVLVFNNDIVLNPENELPASNTNLSFSKAYFIPNNTTLSAISKINTLDKMSGYVDFSLLNNLLDYRVGTNDSNKYLFYTVQEKKSISLGGSKRSKNIKLDIFNDTVIDTNNINMDSGFSFSNTSGIEGVLNANRNYSYIDNYNVTYNTNNLSLKPLNIGSEVVLSPSTTSGGLKPIYDISIKGVLTEENSDNYMAGDLVGVTECAIKMPKTGESIENSLRFDRYLLLTSGANLNVSFNNMFNLNILTEFNFTDMGIPSPLLTDEIVDNYIEANTDLNGNHGFFLNNSILGNYVSKYKVGAFYEVNALTNFTSTTAINTLISNSQNVNKDLKLVTNPISLEQDISYPLFEMNYLTPSSIIYTPKNGGFETSYGNIGLSGVFNIMENPEFLNPNKRYYQRVFKDFTHTVNMIPANLKLAIPTMSDGALASSNIKNNFFQYANNGESFTTTQSSMLFDAFKELSNDPTYPNLIIEKKAKFPFVANSTTTTNPGTLKSVRYVLPNIGYSLNNIFLSDIDLKTSLDTDINNAYYSIFFTGRIYDNETFKLYLYKNNEIFHKVDKINMEDVFDLKKKSITQEESKFLGYNSPDRQFIFTQEAISNGRFTYKDQQNLSYVELYEKIAINDNEVRGFNKQRRNVPFVLPKKDSTITLNPTTMGYYDRTNLYLPVSLLFSRSMGSSYQDMSLVSGPISGNSFPTTLNEGEVIGLFTTATSAYQGAIVQYTSSLSYPNDFTMFGIFKPTDEGITKLGYDAPFDYALYLNLNSIDGVGDDGKIQKKITQYRLEKKIDTNNSFGIFQPLKVNTNLNLNNDSDFQDDYNIFHNYYYHTDSTSPTGYRELLPTARYSGQSNIAPNKFIIEIPKEILRNSVKGEVLENLLQLVVVPIQRNTDGSFKVYTFDADSLTNGLNISDLDPNDASLYSFTANANDIDNQNEPKSVFFNINVKNEGDGKSFSTFNFNQGIYVLPEPDIMIDVPPSVLLNEPFNLEINGIWRNDEKPVSYNVNTSRFISYKQTTSQMQKLIKQGSGYTTQTLSRLTLIPDNETAVDINNPYNQYPFIIPDYELDSIKITRSSANGEYDVLFEINDMSNKTSPVTDGIILAKLASSQFKSMLGVDIKPFSNTIGTDPFIEIIRRGVAPGALSTSITNIVFGNLKINPNMISNDKKIFTIEATLRMKTKNEGNKNDTSYENKLIATKNVYNNTGFIEDTTLIKTIKRTFTVNINEQRRVK